jgi:hypothetical protein
LGQQAVERICPEHQHSRLRQGLGMHRPSLQKLRDGGRIRQPPEVALRAIEETKAILGRVPVCRCKVTRPGENAASLNPARTHWVCCFGKCSFCQEALLPSLEAPLPPQEAFLPPRQPSLAQEEAHPPAWLGPLAETLASGQWQSIGQ